MLYNEEHGITPRTIVKTSEEVAMTTSVADAKGAEERKRAPGGVLVPEKVDDWEMIEYLEEEMLREAEALNFERAASIRDRIEEIRWNLSGRRGRERSG